MSEKVVVQLIAGTRPEFIKLKPVIDALAQDDSVKMKMLLTRQHFSRSMVQEIIEDVKYEMRYGVLTKQLDFRAILCEVEQADAVVVQGDTTSVVLGAAAGVHMKKRVYHVEAGLRSGDMRMREERNRRAVDQMSDVLFAPTPEAEKNLYADRCGGKIYVVGNPIADLVEGRKWRAKDQCLVTLHRPELVRNRGRFQKTLKVIADFCMEKNIGAVFPVHPLTRDMLKQLELEVPARIGLTDPLTPSECWDMIEQSPYVFTDSGGVQEEACIIGTPCFTFRPNTERPETLALGANCLVDPSRSSGYMLETMRRMEYVTGWRHPYGVSVGDAIAKIISLEGPHVTRNRDSTQERPDKVC